MSFQLKLMAAMVGLVVVVTLVVLGVTERKVEVAYSGMYEERYERQIEAFLQRQTERAAFMEGICERAAASELVVRFLRSTEARPDGYNEMRSDLRTVFEGITRGANAVANRVAKSRRGGERPGGRGVKPGGSAGAVLVPLVCLVRQSGEVVPVSGLRDGADSDRYAQIRQAALSGAFEQQGLLYVAVDQEEGGRGVREVVITPVVDPDDGNRLGTLLVGADPKGAPAGMVASRLRKTVPGAEAISSGMVMGEEFFGEGKAWGRGREETVAEIVRRIGSLEGAGSHGHGAFVLGEGGERLRVHYELLNPESEFAKAFHVAVYSLAPLDAELAALRREVLGAGGAGLLVAVLLGYVLARALAVPVRELSAGTASVAGGDLGVRVPVRGRDELARLAGSFNSMAEGLAMKERYRSVLGKVADEAVAEALVAGELELGGEEIEVSVLFCDIRGFTSMSEGRQPAEVIDLLNEHMTAMTDVVYQHRGVVDKFVGDEIMAVFGAPKAYGEDASNAVRCALAMVAERGRLNGAAAVPVEVGIGVATGVVVAGCMGSEHRLNYTVVGERVNLAARLCGAARPGEVVVDAATWGQVEGIPGREERVSLKGISAEVAVWRLGMSPEAATVR